MPVYKLTPKQPDPYTGQQNSYIGWHFVGAEAVDILQALVWLKVYTTWDYHLYADPDNPMLQRVSLTSPLGNVDGTNQIVQVIVGDTDYAVYDSGHVRVISQDDANTDYDITTTTLPQPPPPQQPSNDVLPAMGAPPPGLPGADPGAGNPGAVTIIPATPQDERSA